jgi:hypothetical protein
MASSDPLESQPGSAQCTVTANGFGSILRATGGEAAVTAEEWAEQELVGPDEELKQLCHH